MAVFVATPGTSAGCVDDGYETWDTALDIGSSCGDAQGAIECDVDTDFYIFYPPTSGMYTIEALGPTPIQLSLAASNHDILGSSVPGDGPIQHVLTAGLAYFLRVYDDTFGHQGSYTLRISGCDASCGSDPGDNDTGYATELSGCGSRAATIDCAGDYDYYSFLAPNSGSFTFETTGSTDTELRLYDFNGDAIASDDDSGTGNNAQIIYTLTSGQKYSVAVNEYNNDGTGDYTLVISGCGQQSCGSDPGNDTFSDATTLQVAVEPGILAEGRTYNQVKNGTYGQNIPGLGEGKAVTAHRKGYLVMPAQNAGFRTNLGLINPSKQPVDVEVRLFGTDGNQIGSARSWNLTARAVTQIDRIVRQFTNQDLDAGWLETLQWESKR